MAFEELLDQLAQKRAKALEMGGPEKVARQHAAGKLTARERLQRLLDPDSFLEFGLLATSDMPGMQERTPADGLICGYGRIDGRRVGVIANDFTVLASTNARTNLKKMLQFKIRVKADQVPLIWLGEAGGARMPDCQGARNICTLGGGGTHTLYAEYTHFRQMPFVMAALGECYGVPDFEAMLADCVIQVKGSALSVSGPRALNRAIGQRFTGEEMGGWQIHDEITGIADRVAEDEDDAFAQIRAFLGYMPQNHHQRPPRRPVPEGSGRDMDRILDFLPERRNRSYDMHRIIACMVDGGEIFELKPNFGKMLITCLARIDGEVVGFVANNPIHNVGAMDTDGLEKHTSFLCLCDSFNIPIIFLHDTPGHMVGLEAEKKRVGAKVVNNLQALCQVTVPKIAIVIRKSYGQAAVNMCGPRGRSGLLRCLAHRRARVHGADHRRRRGLRQPLGKGAPGDGGPDGGRFLALSGRRGVFHPGLSSTHAGPGTTWSGCWPSSATAATAASASTAWPIGPSSSNSVIFLP
jgi:acetyl-CoA carboxylase carboxyltransferase component